MRTFLAIAFSVIAISANAAELSEQEIAWGVKARECLATQAKECKVVQTKEGKLTMWCPSKTPAFEQAVSQCNKQANSGVQPAEWTPPKK